MDDTPRITELRKKLEKDPGSRLFAQLAEELRKEARHDDAILVARAGLERNPNYPSARLTLARALLESGRPGAARPELEQVVRAAPDNILASRLLGEALEDLGEGAQALQQFEQALRLAPADKTLGQKVADLRASMSSAPAAAFRPTESAAAPPPVSFELPAAPFPSAFPEPLPHAVPQVVASQVEASPAPSVSVALDRDLASGTFSPGSLTASELQKHFDQVNATNAEAPEALKMDETLGFGDMALESPPPRVKFATSPEGGESASVEVPPDIEDVGASTLPLSSVTLADLYLQQGLKAEASAVLSQVMKEEPENAEAKARFAAVSDDLAQSRPAPAAHPPDILAPDPTSLISAPSVSVAADLASPPGPRARSKAEIRKQSMASLNAFLSAVQREAIQQRAAEPRAF
ncbi:MAG: tetratricopeptide repeat protein [Vicinamibacteria bacterium]|nr:tetratricopeptide repeat protein [Vicinamibacteria bacterium]